MKFAVRRTLLALVVFALLGLVMDACSAGYHAVTRSSPTATVDQDAATVYADPGACPQPDYYAGAWHICGATYPAATEDEFMVFYRDGAWHVVYCDPTVYPNGVSADGSARYAPAPCKAGR